jgi:hypothetical protein
MATIFQWRPTTLQYSDSNLSIAYADDEIGTGFTLDADNKAFFGLYNQTSITPSATPSDYRWFSVNDTSQGVYADFGTDRYLVYINRGSKLFSFNISPATYNGTFVPTDTQFDQILWSALPRDTNNINLNLNTGQKTQVGLTTQNAASGQITVENTSANQLKASLFPLFDYVGGQATFSAATITIDNFGRIRGVTTPDDFYMTIDEFTATSGQTVFTPATRATGASGYITGQDLIYLNGVLLDTSEYTENATTFTLGTGADLNDRLVCVSFRAVSASNFYENLYISVDNIASNVVTWNPILMPYDIIKAGDKITFSNTGTPTQYTVSSVNYSTRQITFTGAVTASVGNVMYRYRASGDSYVVFNRFTDDLVSASNYTPTLWTIANGFENLYLNGSAFNDQDYDISGNTIVNLPAVMTGKLTNIQFVSNNLGSMAGNAANIVTYTVNGQAIYPLTFILGALNLYANGSLLVYNDDYTTSAGAYTFAITPDNNNTILLQQSFASEGAA